ncbi:MAG: helix-turn-helix transcriptional regulator [Lachnospiraceae bacterium]|nr:helix-turn-helix transcriptional regulator [Lachnospiraceae bacterium]
MLYPVLDVKATGERIKELRKACNLKVEDVAEFMGFESVQAVYKWQRGESLPTVDNLFALSRLFGTTVDSILAGKEEIIEEEKEREESESSLLPFCVLHYAA